MSSSSLLTLIGDFFERQEMVRPAAVIGSTDQTVKQARRILQEGIRELQERDDWKMLQVLSPLITHANGTNFLAYDLEANIPAYKWMIPTTMWETLTRIPVAGPLNEMDRSQMITMQVTPAQYSFWYGPGTKGNALYIYPYSATPRFQFQYQSLFAIIDVSLVPKEAFTADTDMSLFPDRILQADLNWRWLKSKGLPYAEEMRSFEIMVANLESNQQPMGAINMGGRGAYADRFMGPGLLIPAGSWNV
jgi:hypothetical protein